MARSSPFYTPGHTEHGQTEGRPLHGAHRRRALAYMGCVRQLDPDAARLVWLDDADRVTIGGARAWVVEEQSGSLAVGVPDRRVSARHAVLERTGARWRLCDPGSTNGTFVGGQRLSEHVLRPGDVIETGSTFWRYLEYLPRLPKMLSRDPFAQLGPTRTLCPALIESLALLKLGASGKAHVLIIGETGTGKEVVADQSHAWSGRKGPLHKVNCANMTAERADGELFGWKKGGFTGADRDHPGHLEAASGGTLMLDEIGDLPQAIQPKLLRVLQDGEFYRIGDTRPRSVDLRIVAATNRDLSVMVRGDTFSEALYGRLAQQIRHLPPLRERLEDLCTLFAHHLREVGAAIRVQPTTLRRLLLYGWPRNIRELNDAIDEALRLTGSEGVLLPEHFTVGPAPAREAPPKVKPAPGRQPDPELCALLDGLLQEHRGKVSAVARGMGVHRKQVYRYLERCGLNAADYKPPRHTRL